MPTGWTRRSSKPLPACCPRRCSRALPSLPTARASESRTVWKCGAAGRTWPRSWASACPGATTSSKSRTATPAQRGCAGPGSAVLLLQPGIGKELRHVGTGRLGHRLGADPGGQFPGNGIAPLVQAVGKAAFHAFAVHDPVLLVHADGVHAAAGGTYRPGDETFDRLCRLVGFVHAACS